MEVGTFHSLVITIRMLLIFFSNYSLFTFSTHYEIPRSFHCVKDSFHVKNILFFCRFVMRCGRQLESVRLHIIIHGKEIQARIANFMRAETLLSCYCITCEMNDWTGLSINLVHHIDHMNRFSYAVYIVTYPEFASLRRRVLDLMLEFIGPLYNWLQQFTLSSTSDCTLHWIYSDF
jgi:hypothetical protein